MGEEILLQHVEFAYINYISIIVFCTIGIILNAIMLVYLIKKKQVLASIYSIYMIQIVSTDILVCMVWLVMLVLMLRELPLYHDIRKYPENNQTDNSYLLMQAEESFSKGFATYRIIFAVYYMHYYINIFLLAVMSIERCMAVKKSLQCQRYQFKKNVVCVVSAGMWLTAIACAVPSYINPDWITESEQTDLLLGRVNEHDNSVFAKTPTNVVLSCYQPLYNAEINYLNEVRDFNDVSVEECFYFMQEYIFEHIDSMPELFPDVTGKRPGQHENGTQPLTKRDLNASKTIDYGITLEREHYEITFKLFAKAVHILSQKDTDIDGLCDPRLSKSAKVYQIITNLVVGFFLPFVIIVVMNVYIAYHIWLPAQKRLENRKKDLRGTIQFPPKINQFSSRYSGMEEGKCNGPGFATSVQYEPIQPKNEEKENIELQCINPSESKKLIETPPIVKKCLSPHSFGQEEACERHRERTPSFLRMLQKTFRNSTNSAESFPTDLTSLVMTSSPGISQSKQAFFFGEETESQLTGSSNSSKRTSIKSHTVIPEINIITEQIENSLQQLSLNNNKYDSLKQNKENPAKNIANVEATTMNEPIETTPPSSIQQQDRVRARSATVPSIGEAPLKSVQRRNESRKPQSFSRLLPTTRMQQRSEAETHDETTQVQEASYHSAAGGSIRSHVTLYKNAERQIQLSRIILFYVAIFVVSWLPSKVVMAIYYIDGYIGKTGHFCHRVFGLTRILSFISVLLNPIVYAATQKSVNRYLRQCFRQLCPRHCLCTCVEKIASKLFRRKDDLSDVQCSRVKVEELENGILKAQRHEKNRRRWSKIVERLGSKNLRSSYSASHRNISKISDGTIDEEREGRRH